MSEQENETLEQLIARYKSAKSEIKNLNPEEIINIAIGIIMSFLTVIFAATINNQAIVILTVISVIEALFVTSYCSVFFNRVCGLIYRESIK